MAKLSAFETSGINITKIAVPEVESSPSHPFFAELKKLRPQLEEIIARSKAGIPENFVLAAWAEKMLFDHSSFTEDDIEKIITMLDEEYFDALNYSEIYWSLVYVKWVCEIEPYAARANELLSRLLYHLDFHRPGDGQRYTDEYLHTLAAAKILFPFSLEISNKIVPEIISFLYKTVEARSQSQGMDDTVLFLLRDLIILSPVAAWTAKHPRWDTVFTQGIEDKLSQGYRSQEEALVKLATYKLVLADSVLFRNSGAYLTFNQSTGVKDQPVNTPPTQRSF